MFSTERESFPQASQAYVTINMTAHHLTRGNAAGPPVSSSPPEKADNDPARRTLHPSCQSYPRTEAREEAHRVLHTRWGIQLAAHLSESTAWAIYRDRLKRFGSLIGDREPIVLRKRNTGHGPG